MSTSPTQSPDTNPKPISLGHLYHRLDWSAMNRTFDRWSMGKYALAEMDPEWGHRWRCAILESALAEDDGSLPEGQVSEDGTRRSQAIWMLKRMGVWGQVCKILKKRDLIPPEDSSLTK